VLPFPAMKTAPIALLLLLLLLTGCGATTTLHPLASARDLPVGHIIESADLFEGTVVSSRTIWPPFGVRPPAPEFTEDRAKVVGHRVLRFIPKDRLVDVVRDIS
jgi:hypothetical protein